MKAWMRHAFWLLVGALLSFTFWQLKAQAQLGLVMVVGLAAGASAWPSRATAIVLGLVIALLVFGVAISGSVSLAVMLFPAHTSDGHPVMPIGQVLLGGTAGVVLGAGATVGYFRVLRERKIEARYLALLAVLLIVEGVVDALV